MLLYYINFISMGSYLLIILCVTYFLLCLLFYAKYLKVLELYTLEKLGKRDVLKNNTFAEVNEAKY